MNHTKKYMKKLEEGDVVRILNVKQALFYWYYYQIEPLSIYPSKDYKTGEPVIVYVFSKSETKEAYKEWTDNKPSQL